METYDANPIDGLVTVAKDGNFLHVNPDCLSDHLSIGWKVWE